MEVFKGGEEADAGPAFRFHFVEVLEAGEVSRGIGSSGFSSFLADWVGGSDVVDTGDLEGLGALLGRGKAGKQTKEGKD